MKNSRSEKLDTKALSKEEKEFLKSESESLHKLIKEFNDEALNILYATSQQNTTNDPSGPNEYLVISRKLSEMKPNVTEPNVDSDNDEPTDIEKSIQILEQARYILTNQKEKGVLVIKPIYCSIIYYNLACCNQQLNNLKECDELLSEAIQYLIEDINIIDKELNNKIT